MAEWPLVISYFTPGYADLALKLEASAKRHGLPHHIREVEDRGSWEKNCALKSSYILDHLLDGPVLWVDADAEFLRKPRELAQPKDFDFAIHRRPDETNRMQFASGVVYLDKGAIELAREWERQQAMEPKMWDQQTLWRAYKALGKTAPKTFWLPKTYLTKVDEPSSIDTVVVHAQASRTRKNKR